MGAMACPMEHLKQYLAANNLRPAHFAKRLDVTRAMVSRWLDGTHVPADRYKIAIHKETNGAVPAACWLKVD